MTYKIQKIQPIHDTTICEIIKTVGKEFGAIGDGYGPSDAEVNAMSQHYNDATLSRYWVATINDSIVGGGGIAAFNGSREVCELRKLFFLSQARGLGLGKQLSENCLDFAKRSGYKRCYLDTLKIMTSAVTLYEKLGFTHLDAPLDGTIHNACDVWMVKELA